MAGFEFSWAVFTGVLSILTIIPGSLFYIHSQLPSQQIRTMFDALKEADELLLSCTEEGLVYGTKAVSYRSTLDQLHVRAEGARFEAHAARTYAEDVANWIKGLSRTIRQICWKVRDVRAEISTTSLRERERQAALRNLSDSSPETSQRVTADDAEVSPSSSPSPVVVDVSVARDGADTSMSAMQLHDTTPSSAGKITTSYHRDDTLPPITAPDVEHRTSICSMATPPIVQSMRKMGHRDRRYSVSSVSSGASSLQSMRRKKRGGDPLFRARTMARFMRQTRATRSPPVFIVNPHRLAALELVGTDDDSDDDDWVDEKAVGIIA